MKTVESSFARRIGALLAIVALIATACGSSGDSGGTQAEESVVTTGADGTKSITIGVAYQDLGPVAILDDQLSIGDPEEQANAIVRQWQEESLLPENIEVELAFEKYPVGNRQAQQALCTAFEEDHGAFAVIAGLDFQTGALCLSDRFNIPVISAGAAPPATYEQFPNYLTLEADEGTWLRSYGAWALEQIAGDAEARVGLYWETPLTQGVEQMRQQFAAAGIEIVEEVETSGEGIGNDATDPTAVQKFLAADVTHVLTLKSGYGFQARSEEQEYRPVILETDYRSRISNTNARAAIESQYDGTPGFTVRRIGATATGGINDAAEACLSNYEGFSGNTYSRTEPESSEFQQILLTCDQFSVLLAGLAGLETGETSADFIAAIEAAGEFEFGSVGNGSFSPGDHSGSDEFQTVEWDENGCRCWRSIADFEPAVPLEG